MAKHRKTIDFPADDIEWFEREYGKDANFTAVAVMLLKNFRSIHEDTGVTPTRVIRDSAKELKQQIEDGSIEI